MDTTTGGPDLTNLAGIGIDHIAGILVGAIGAILMLTTHGGILTHIMVGFITLIIMVVFTGLMDMDTMATFTIDAMLHTMQEEGALLTLTETIQVDFQEEIVP